MQCPAPEGFEVIVGQYSAPVAAHDIVIVSRPLREQRGGEHVRGNTVVERLDERLNDAYRSVESERVAPALEGMQVRQVPAADRCGFVRIESMVHGKRNFAKCLANGTSAGAV